MKSQRVEIVLWEIEMEPFAEISEDAFRLHFDIETEIETAIEKLRPAPKSSILDELLSIWHVNNHRRSYELGDSCVVISSLKNPNQ